MKKILGGAIISLIGVIYSTSFIALITDEVLHDKYLGTKRDFWYYLQDAGVMIPLIISLAIVLIGIAFCIWGIFEKKK